MKTISMTFTAAFSLFTHQNHGCRSFVHAFVPRTTTARTVGFSTRTFQTSLLASSSSSDASTALPADHPYLDTIQPALSAVRKACRITTYLQPNTVQAAISGITKKDASPVTIGDFASQAVILNVLEDKFKTDVFVAEEGSKALENDEKDGGDDDEAMDLSSEILNILQTCGYEHIIGDIEELKRSIDLGQTYQPNGELLDELKVQKSEGSQKQRTWCLDPIDGTRGFLRGKREGGQYCVALALMEDGVPVVGIMGCPNLPASPDDENYAWPENETNENNSQSRGCIIVASKNGGCYQLPLYPPSNDEDEGTDNDSSTENAVRIKVSENVSLPESRFCLGVEKYGDPEGKLSSIAEKVHGSLDSDGEILHTRRMDSQVKYAVLARGGGEMFARLPKKSYVEWIWDHACGRIVIEEAGGVQTDEKGNLIDYGLGAKMDANVNGILASSGGGYHEALLNACMEVEEQK